MNFSNIIFSSSQRVKCVSQKLLFFKLLGVIAFFYLMFTVYDIFDIVTVQASDDIVKSNFDAMLNLFFYVKNN